MQPLSGLFIFFLHCDLQKEKKQKKNRFTQLCCQQDSKPIGKRYDVCGNQFFFFFFYDCVCAFSFSLHKTVLDFLPSK